MPETGREFPAQERAPAARREGSRLVAFSRYFAVSSSTSASIP